MLILEFSSLFRNTTASLSPALFITGLTYTAGRNGYIYVPEGYSNNSDNYPLIVYGHGYGERSSTVTDLLANGIPKYLQAGDRPPNVLIAMPQIPSGDFTATDWDNVISFMTTNYRINSNRKYITGFSGGGFWTKLVAQNRTSDIAALVGVSTNYGTGWNWSGTTADGQSNIQHFYIHGTADGTVTNGQQTFLSNSNSSSFDINQNIETLALWGLDHVVAVWNTNCYNRKERTDDTGTATFDYVRYLKRFSKDQTERATLHVSNAEETLDIIDWRKARQQVDVMTGATKSSLLSRLATVKSTIDNGGKRYIIDQGSSTVQTTGHTIVYVNNQTAHTNGATISNLVDDENGSSSIGFTIVSQFASSGRETTTSRLRGKYFGFDRAMINDSMTISTTITGGTCKFTGLNNAKLYNIRIYHGVATGSYTNNATINVTIGGVTKTQYSECNNTLYIEYLNLSPSSGEIVISIKCDQDKNTGVNGFELFQQA